MERKELSVAVIGGLAAALALLPAGLLDELVPASFTEKESSALRGGFLTSFSDTKIKGGRTMITREEASDIGKRLAEVLFPKEVFRLFAMSLALVAGTAGLRIRLSMDPPACILGCLIADKGPPTTVPLQ